MKVCLVSPMPPPIGGIANWTRLMHKTASGNEEITFIQVDTAPRWRAITNTHLAVRVLGGGIQLLRDCLRLISVLKGRPDIIHLTSSGQLAGVRDIAVLMLARIFRTPAVYHLRFGRIPEIAETNTLEWRLLAQAMRLADIVLTISRTTTKTIKTHLPKTRVLYVPNPVDTMIMLSPLTTDKKSQIVLFLGWVVPSKGIEELLEAWSDLAAANWKLYIAGPIASGYKAYLIEKFKPANIRFTGELAHADAMHLMAKADVFVLPSHTEGFPNAVLEAMALGKAVIATAVGAVPDMLSNDCGVLVLPQNTSSLRTAIEQLISDAPRREELGTNAQRKVLQNYAIQNIFPRYVECWRCISRK